MQENKTKPPLLFTEKPMIRWADTNRLKLCVNATGTRERDLKLLFNKGLGF